MDDYRPEAEARMRQSFGLSTESKSSAAEDPQRLARQAIRSQAAARDYADRQLVRAEQTIQDLQSKLQAVWREKTTALAAARTAHAVLAEAERGRRVAETALLSEKSVSECAQRDAREARAVVQDLRAKLALTKETAKALETQLAQAREVQILSEDATAAPALRAPDAIPDMPIDQPVKRKRGRPPGKRASAVPLELIPPAQNTSAADPAPVQWWPDDWTPPG